MSDSESSRGSDPGEDEPDERFWYTTRHDGRRIMVSLDKQQQQMLPEHLLSAHQLRYQLGFPKPWWVSWPQSDAPIPKDIDEYDNSDDEPTFKLVTEKHLKQQKEDAERGHPDRQLSATRFLLDACESFLQKEVYKRISEEPDADLEAVTSPSPHLGPVGPVILETLGQWMRPISSKPLNSQPLDWTKIIVNNPNAAARLERLYGDRLSYKPPPKKLNWQGKNDNDVDNDSDETADNTASNTAQNSDNE